MLQNAYFLGKIGADTAENEQHFAEILPTDALCVGVGDALPPESTSAAADDLALAAAQSAPGWWRALVSSEYASMRIELDLDIYRSCSSTFQRNKFLRSAPKEHIDAT